MIRENDFNINKIEILVRALIIQNGKILVCKKIGKDHYFLPGGHLNYGESIKRGLKRELKEELGLTFKKCQFIGFSEHQFVEDGKNYHEINFIFKIQTNKVTSESKENHLQFFFFDKNQFSKEKIVPKVLKKAILKWLKDKKPFWVSEI